MGEIQPSLHVSGVAHPKPGTKELIVINGAPLFLWVGTLIAARSLQQGFVLHKHRGGNGFGANTAPEPVIRRDCFYRNQAQYPVPLVQE